MKPAVTFLSPLNWTVYLVLFVFAIPWYWPEGDERIFLGFPLWVVVTIGISFVISLYTAWLFVKRWPEYIEEDAE